MKGGCHTYSYEPSTASGRSPILTQIQLGGGGTRSYQFGPAGHLESTALGSGITFFDTDAAGRLFNLERTLPPAGVAFRYDGRGYLTFADSARVLPFADGFESGTTCFWGATVGLMPPAPVCPPPKPTVHPTYSSEGLLHALTRNVAPQRSLVFHFAGRPVAQLDLTRSAESWKFLTTDPLGTPIVATNTSGSLLWQGGFEPFGADWSGAAGAGVFLRFPGQWEEAAWANSGMELYENVHRYFLPGIGRYTRPDPLGGGAFPYLYVAQHPTILIDPLGLCCETPQAQSIKHFDRRDVAGTVICCDGKPTPCLNFRNEEVAQWRRGFDPIVNQFLLDCATEHEQRHADFHVTCPPVCGVTESNPKSDFPLNFAECDAWRTQGMCLWRKKAACGGDIQCQSAIFRFILRVRPQTAVYGCPGLFARPVAALPQASGES